MSAPSRRSFVRRLSLGAVALAATTLLAPSAANAAGYKVGNVYTQTNDLNDNMVVAFARYSDGTLTETQRIDTGGKGLASPACAMPTAACPIADSQGAVALTPDGSLVFATNSGSNTITSFRVTSGGLRFAQRISSGGAFPQSVDVHGRVLYVLNQDSGTIQGFKFTSTGRMKAIPGSRRSLATPGPKGVGAEIAFDRHGRTLTVTERGTNLIDTFVVKNGVAGHAIAHNSSAVGPFGFAYDTRNHLVVSDALSQKMGAASTYLARTNGALIPLVTRSTTGGAPCWVVITPDSRYVYITNTTTKTIARFALGADGTLTLLGLTPTLNSPPGPVLFPTDEAMSRDGRFLYVLIPSVFGPAVSRIDEYGVGANGELTLIGSTPSNMGPGVTGLAAH